MSLVPPTYLCCQPLADQAVSGKRRRRARPGAREPGTTAAGPPQGITKYGIYRSKRGINDRR
jgi:hypothetical protein